MLSGFPDGIAGSHEAQGHPGQLPSSHIHPTREPKSDRKTLWSSQAPCPPTALPHSLRQGSSNFMREQEEGIVLRGLLYTPPPQLLPLPGNSHRQMSKEQI